jgi:hypothetical protein
VLWDIFEGWVFEKSSRPEGQPPFDGQLETQSEYVNTIQANDSACPRANAVFRVGYMIIIERYQKDELPALSIPCPQGVRPVHSFLIRTNISKR